MDNFLAVGMILQVPARNAIRALTCLGLQKPPEVIWGDKEGIFLSENGLQIIISSQIEVYQKEISCDPVHKAVVVGVVGLDNWLEITKNKM